MSWTPRQSRWLGTSDGSVATAAISSFPRRTTCRRMIGDISGIQSWSPLLSPMVSMMFCREKTNRMVPALATGRSVNGYGEEGLGKKVTPFGLFQSHSGGGYNDQITFPGRVLNTATYYCVFYKVGACTRNLITVSGPSGETDAVVTLNSDGTVRFQANANVDFSSVTPLPDGLCTVIFINDRIAAKQTAYVNGEKITAEAASSAQQGFTATWLVTGGSSTGNVSCGIVGICGRVWSAKEAADFHQNPFSLGTVSRSQPIWVPA